MSKTGVASTSHAQELFVLSCFGCFALLSVVCHLLGSCRYSMEACSSLVRVQVSTGVPSSFFPFLRHLSSSTNAAHEEGFLLLSFRHVQDFYKYFYSGQACRRLPALCFRRIFLLLFFRNVTFNILIDCMFLLAKSAVVYQHIASGGVFSFTSFVTFEFQF